MLTVSFKTSAALGRSCKTNLHAVGQSAAEESKVYTEYMEFNLLIIVSCAVAICAMFVWRERAKQLKAALKERDQARQERDELRTELGNARVEIARYESADRERENAIQQSRRERETHFKGIAAEVLKANTDELRKRTNEELQGQRELARKDLDARERAVENLVKPLREGLDKLHKHVIESDQARVAATTEVSASVGQLMTETSGLRKILHNPQLRGQWGEQHLRNVLEAAGMTSHVDYLEQGTLEGGAHGAQLRPDVVVNIPGGAKVVIDAKTPHQQYDEALRCEDDPTRRDLLKRHSKALANHAKELAHRNYAQWIEGSPDFVMMYVPTDPMLDAAIAAEPTIWQETWQRHRVLIATPGLLIAFLRTVALAWSRVEIQNNAEEISKAGKELYARLAKFASHVDKMGRGLRQAVDAYNDSVGSFESRLLVQARRFEELSAVESDSAIGEITPLESTPRRLNAPELHHSPGAEN